VYDGLNPVQEQNGDSQVIANMLTGLNTDEYFTRAEPACCGPLSYLTDALGSTESLVDSTGTVQYNYQYEPFGLPDSTIFNVDTTSSYQFTGRENDQIGVGSSLNYYRARYYNAAFQRFLSQDPLDFAGGDTNLYGYVRENPVNDTDATGLCGDHPCVGWARQLQGNLGTVGHTGAFGTAVPAEGADIDPAQWGGKGAVGSIRGGISGVVGPFPFSGIGDVIGGPFGTPVPGMNTRQGLESLNPGLLIAELPGAPLDLGVVPVVLMLPNGVPCPVGTVSAKQQDMCARVSSFVRYLAGISALASGALVVHPASVSAVCPKPHPPVCAEFFHSDAVFVGTVTSVRYQQEAGESGWVYELRVTKRFRGSGQPVVDVFTEDASERFPLEKDNSYLLFAHAFPGGLEIDSCGNSVELGRAAGIVHDLERVLSEIKSGATGGYLNGRVVKSSDTEAGVEGISLGVQDGARTYRAVTGKGGWFHLRLSAGKYTVQPQTSTWLVSPYDLSYDRPDNVVIHDGGCAELQFLAFPR